jgi:transcription elongation factor GreB
MSKAFVNENNDQAGSDEELDRSLEDADDAEAAKALPKGSKNYITPVGFSRLKDELHELMTVERPKTVEVVAWAASNGDRSENADYIYGKRRLREIDRRIRFLQKRMDIAQIVDPSLQSGEKVLFGATVRVRDEDENERTYKIVGMDETDAKNGHVSWISPIGQALLQGQVGDQVTLKSPKGEEDLEILEVRFDEVGSSS